jgi:inhibitor of cysteine peptidase
MLLVGDRLVVFSSGWCNDFEKRRHRHRHHKHRRHLSSIIGPIYGSEETQFTLYSTANLGIIGSSQTLPGSYTGARAIGDHVYVVTSRYLNVYSYTGPLDPYTLTTPAMYESNTKLTKEAYEEMAWQKANETVDEFIAQLTAGMKCEEMQQITLFQNTDSFFPPGPVAESIASVTAFNVKTPTVTTVTSRVMPTSYWQMYASADTLLLTAEGYWVGDDVASETYVLAYQLADATATPLGLGKVPGSLLNQFSMDEHNGYMRFATTIRERFRYVNGKYTSVADSDNLIVILKSAASSGKLEEVGRLAGLGKAKEQIYSVRFLADRAFVVRFVQTPIGSVATTDFMSLVYHVLDRSHVSYMLLLLCCTTGHLRTN